MSRTCPVAKAMSLTANGFQQLHTFGLLNGSFPPKDEVLRFAHLSSLRDTLVKDCNSHVLRMQKVLTEMNVQIHRVLSDITGYTGMAIIRAILTGERNALTLAQMKHPQVKASTEQIVKALEGDYRPEHLFALQTAVELMMPIISRSPHVKTRLSNNLNSSRPSWILTKFLSKAEL